MPTPKTIPEKSQESQDKEKKPAPQVTKENDAARAKLAESTKKPEKPKKEPEKKPEPMAPNKPEKKEKNWHLVHGTLSAENRDGSMSSSTTGIGIENKKGTAQVLFGPTTTAERGPSGERKEQVHPLGVTGVIRF